MAGEESGPGMQDGGCIPSGAPRSICFAEGSWRSSERVEEVGITVLIGVGLATVMAWTTFPWGMANTRVVSRRSLGPAWPGSLSVALFVYAGGLLLAERRLNPCDDLVAYYTFCEKLLATGSFHGEPFSWRSPGVRSGAILCCSATVSGIGGLRTANAQAFEVALSPVIVLGLVLGFRGGTLGRSPLGGLLGLIAVTTPIGLREHGEPLHRRSCSLWGSLVTLDLAERAQARRVALLCVAGLVGAAACSLRAQYVPAVGAALGLFWLAWWIKDRPSCKLLLVEGGASAGSLFVALLPWMTMSFLSNGSPLFPFFQGHNNPGFIPPSVDESLTTRLATVVQMILFPALLPLLLLRAGGAGLAARIGGASGRHCRRLVRAFA